MRRIGLSGASIVPLLLGFGLFRSRRYGNANTPLKTRPAIDRASHTIMSCSAKIPVYGLIAAAMFPRYVTLVVPCLYILGIVLCVITALFLRRTVFRGEASPFLLELPPYRFPSLNRLAGSSDVMQGNSWSGLSRSSLLVTLIIWVLETYDFRFSPAASPESSMLSVIAGKVAPFFAPLGFDSTPAVSALLAGFPPKRQSSAR